MTSKTIKTILFASLIVAMILPFSGMTMAEAAPNENASEKAKQVAKHTKDIEKVQKIIGDYKDAMKQAKGEDKKKMQKGLDRLILGEKILKAFKISAQADTLSDAKASNELIRQYADELEATYDGEVVETITIPTLDAHSSPNTPTIMSHVTVDVDINSNYSQSATDCSTNTTVSGSVATNYKSWTSGAATISSTFSYPSTYSERAFPWSDCVTFNHDRTTERHYVLTSWIPGADPGNGQPCHTEKLSPTGSDSTSCSHFGPALITVVILENEYGNNTGVQLGWIGGGVIFS